MKHSYCVHYDGSDMNIFEFWTNKNGTNWTIALARRASFQKHGSHKAHKQNLNEKPPPSRHSLQSKLFASARGSACARGNPLRPQATPSGQNNPSTHPARTTHPPDPLTTAAILMPKLSQLRPLSPCNEHPQPSQARSARGRACAHSQQLLRTAAGG